MSQIDELIAKALEAKESAYCPYSNFRVGACLLSEDGSFTQGANIENAAYGAGICAERTAMVSAVYAKRRPFKALAVSSDLKMPISPCGVCRQFLREFCGLSMEVYLLPADYDKETTKTITLAEFNSLKEKEVSVVVKTTIDEILPFSFGPEYLDKPRLDH